MSIETIRDRSLIGSNFKLIKTDKNGSEYWEEVDVVCPKCNGSGYLNYFSHISGGVCFLCNGSGEYARSFTYKLITPEYAEKLDAKEEKKIAKLKAEAASKNAKHLKDWGFNEEGIAYLIVTNCYDIKEQLKEQGAKYSTTYQSWYFAEKPADYETIEISVDDLYEKNYVDEYMLRIFDWDEIEALRNRVKTERARLAAETSTSEYVGEIKDRMDLELIFKGYVAFDNNFGGITCIYKFEDINGNVYVWKTSTFIGEHKDGDHIFMTATIKDHSEYKGIKQTVLTRCKIA